MRFNPRLPHGRRLSASIAELIIVLFQSTPPAREATKYRDGVKDVMIVSIHASRTGGDLLHLSDGAVTGLFQSTPPAREATCQPSPSSPRLPRFNPRLPHGRRLETPDIDGDFMEFQSTPPAREATCHTSDCISGGRVSIHASRTGGDPVHGRTGCSPSGFNPRLPHGRRLYIGLDPSLQVFQSTPPAREATLARVQ